MRTPHELVMEWHQAFNVPVGEAPSFPPEERLDLRMELIREEYEELKLAVEDGSLVQVMDALADMTYVIFGMAIECGVNLDLVMEEVQHSNMSKLDENSDPILRDDGKILKGPFYSPPDIARVLGVRPQF